MSAYCLFMQLICLDFVKQHTQQITRLPKYSQGRKMENKKWNEGQKTLTWKTCKKFGYSCNLSIIQDFFFFLLIFSRQTVKIMSVELVPVFLWAVTNRTMRDKLMKTPQTSWHLDSGERGMQGWLSSTPCPHSALIGCCVSAWPSIGSPCCHFLSSSCECRTAGEAWRLIRKRQVRRGRRGRALLW